MNPPILLIVDDEKSTRDGLRLALEDRYDVFVADDAASATELLERERFDVLLTDLRLPKEDGLRLIERAKSLPKPPVCILMTAYGSDETIVEAMKRGADDYIAKGRMEIDLLELKIEKALRSRKLESENTALHQQLDHKYGLEHIVGESPAMCEVFETVRQVADSRATVLVRGESGTGEATRRDEAFVLTGHRARCFDKSENSLLSAGAPARARAGPWQRLGRGFAESSPRLSQS